MKKARNFWRDLPQGGSRYGSVLTRLFLLLCLLATTQAGWADTELVRIDFTKWTNATLSSGDAVTRSYIGETGTDLYFKGTSNKSVSIVDNGLTFNGQNFNAGGGIAAIKLTGINGSITVTITHPYSSNKPKFKYCFKDGATSWETSNVSGTNMTAPSSNGDPVTVTVNNITNTSGILYIGEVSTSYPVISTITVTTPSSAATHSITLNANGGSANGSATATEGSNKLTNITNPTYAGHTLNGYYKEEGCTNLIADASGNLQPNTDYTDASGNWDSESNQTLYAKWTESTAITWDFTNHTAASLASNKTTSYTADDGVSEMRYTAGSSDAIVAKNGNTDGYFKENGGTGSASATDVDNTTSISKTRLIRLFVDGTGTLRINCTGNIGVYKIYDGGTNPQTIGSQLISSYTANNTTDEITVSNFLWIETTSKGYINSIVWTPTSAAAKHNITTAVTPASSGSVALSATSVAEGGKSNATATPATGYTFSSWSITGTGATLSSSSENPTTITMGTDDVTVTATFKIAAPSRTVVSGSGTSIGTNEYNYAESLQIKLTRPSSATKMYYTTDGTDPTNSGTRVEVTASEVTLDAFTAATTVLKYYATDDTNNSDVMTITYHNTSAGKVNPTLTWPDDNETATMGVTFTSPTVNKVPSNLAVTYASSNESVATVNNSGVVTLVGAGTTIITANSAEQTISSTTYKAASASYTLTVNNQTVTLAWATSGAKSMTIGDTYDNAATATSAATSLDPSTGTITYSSSNSSIASVSSAGVVTAKAPGTATITASYAANGIYNAATPITYEVTVRAAASGKVWDFTADESADYAAATEYWEVDGSNTNYFKNKFTASSTPYQASYTPESQTSNIEMLNGIRFQRNGSSISTGNYRWFVPKDENDGYLRFGGSNYGIVLTGLTAGHTYTIDCQASGNNDFVISNANITTFGSTTRGETQFTVSEGQTEVFIYAKNSGSKIFKITEGASTTVTVADPTVTPKTGSEEDNTFATNSKTVDFACATELATIKYVVGTTKQTDIGAIKNSSLTGGSNTSVNVSDGVTGQCNLWISAVAVKTVGGVDYTSDPVYVELVYAGPKTAELRKTDIQMQSGNYKAIDVTITDNDGNPILFGEEDVSNVDYTTYYDFEYELTASESTLITLEDIEGHTVVNSRVGDNKAPAGSTATVRVTATPKAGSGIDSYVANPNATLTADVNVTITAETTGIGWVDFYWDEACTKPITEEHQHYTGPAKDKNMVFNNFPNGKTIYLKMNTEQVDTICFYYNNYDQTKPSANVSKTSSRKIITKNSTNSKLARSASYLYRHAIPIYMHEELTGDPADKKVWVTLAGYKGTSTAVYGNIINMEFTLANNGLKTADGTRPAAPTYTPETPVSEYDKNASGASAVKAQMKQMTTTQSSVAVGETEGTVMAKYSTNDSYNIIHLVNMPSDDNPRTLNVGKGSVGVFSTKKSLDGTVRKTTGVQFVDGVVSEISNAFYTYYPAQKEVTMSFEPEETTVHINNTTAFTKPTLNITPAEGEAHIRPLVTYSYTESATGAGRIESIANDGTITWASSPQPGVVTVKASFDGDAYNVDPSYAHAEATYQIYVIDPDKEVIYIKPGSCDFYNEMDVTLEGANNWTGYYTTTESDTEPEFNTTTWTRLNAKQTAMIHLRNTTNVWAYVFDPDKSQKANGTHQKFTLKTVAKPTLYPDGVTSTYYFHGSSLEVTASTSVAEASVYYIVDGDKDDLADGGGTRYEGRITLDDTKIHTIYAVTQDKDGHRSEIVTGTYMKASTLEEPWFNINNGDAFASGQTKEINTSDKIYLVDKTGDNRAEIYYTVDGSSPTTSSTKYTGPNDAFFINKSGTVVKAISVLLGDVSPISTATFTFAASSDNRFWEANSYTCDENGKLRDNNGKSGAVISQANNSRSYVKFITATFGSIYEDSKDDWKHISIGEESKGDPIDGVGTYQIATGYNPQDENGDLYTHMNSSSSLKVHERTFKLPARGAYVRFEPEKDGDLTIWALQQGGVYYTDATEGQEKFLSGFIRKRPVYMIDEQGICQAAKDIKAAGKLSDDWTKINRDDLLGNDQPEHSQSGVEQTLYKKAEAQAIYDMYDAQIGAASTDNIQDMLIYINDGTHQAAAIAGIGDDTTTGEEIGICIPSASYMRYTYKVRAGKTYFFFAQRTKLGIRGFRFDPDATYTEQAITIDPTKENISDAISNYASLSDEKKTENVTVKRKFKNETWAALVLPFSVSRQQLKQVFGENTSVLHVDRQENYTLYLHKHHYGMIVAGTPILIYPSGRNVEEIENPVFNGVQIETTDITPTGDTQIQFLGSICKGQLLKNDMYINADGNFTQWLGNTVPVSGTYAWLRGVEQGAKLSLRYTSYDEEDDDPIATGIQIVTDGEGNFGEVNGNGDIYNISGQLVGKKGTSKDKLAKGVYIQNGKKVVIK